TGTGAQLGITCWIGFLAKAHLNRGRADLALELLREAPATVLRTGERMYEVELYQLTGEAMLRTSKPDLDGAAESFRKSIELARRRGAKLMELRASLSLARLLQSQGEPDKAYPLIAEIYGSFTEGFDTPDLKDARDFLGAVVGHNFLGKDAKHPSNELNMRPSVLVRLPERRETIRRKLR